MPAINDPANTRSLFPFTRDTFVNEVDGLSSASVIDAEIWNKIESAIYRMEVHQRSIVQKADNRDHKRVRRTNVVTVPATTGLAVATFVLSASEMNLLSSNPFQLGNMMTASVQTRDNDLSYIHMIEMVEPNIVKVRFRRQQESTNIPAGAYVVHLCVWGL